MSFPMSRIVVSLQKRGYKVLPGKVLLCDELGKLFFSPATSGNQDKAHDVLWGQDKNHSEAFLAENSTNI